jgi:hypothetical protein
VTWKDAEHDSDFSGEAHEAGNLPILVYAGYLVKKTAEMVVVASEICEEDNTVRFIISIPAKIVVSIKELV